MEINSITETIIGCAIKVHRAFGPGLLESVYSTCLTYELVKAGLFVQQQQAMPLTYKDIHIEVGYRLNLLVERKVIVEVKSVEGLMDVHTAQVLTYLKLTKAEVGLLINFNVLKLADGIKRLDSKK